MLTSSSIHESLALSGLHCEDLVMIHADAGPAAQMTSVPSAERLNAFIASILSFFNKGTVVVPTFSYSLTKGEIFDRDATPSDIGLFSEYFRKLDGVSRSCHPIFSVAVYGKNADRFSQTTLEDCFGEGTLFDELYMHNAKILCLGCSLDRVTFTHFAEQRLGVGYRYFKTFTGEIRCGRDTQTVKTRYLVRDLDLDTACDLDLLRERALANGLLHQASIGRFPLLSISAKDFVATATDLVGENPLALIRQRRFDE